MTRYADKLIEQALTGRSAHDLLEEYADEMPSLAALAKDVYQELQARLIEGTVEPSKKEGNVLYVLVESRDYRVDAILEVFEHAYPEVRFLLGTQPPKESR